MKDKFWNFVFYKFIFVFGVVNVQYLNEVRRVVIATTRVVRTTNQINLMLTIPIHTCQVILWVSWFTVLGFLHLLSQLCKDRFEYVS